MSFRCVLHAQRRRPLAACFASIFALSAPAAAIADTWIVNSCDEDAHATAPGPKTGTLRYALANATSPAIIDMAGLAGAHACAGGSIVLSTLSGELKTNLNTLTIFGPGRNVLKIDASAMLASAYGDLRVLHHYGSGKLTIHNLAITGGHATHNYQPLSTSGGCISSDGDVELDGVSVSSCFGFKISYNLPTKGGAVYAAGAVTLSNSTVSGSHATALGTNAYGGGVHAGTSLTLVNGSSINQNYVYSKSGMAMGGGAYSKGDVTLNSSTISQNTATSAALYAPAYAGGVFAGGNLSLSNAFVSSNAAAAEGGKAAGGGALVRGDAGAYFSVIDDNSATSKNDSAKGGGAYVTGTLSLANSNLRSNTLIAGSTTAGGGATAIGGFSADYSTIEQNSAAGFGLGGGIYSNGNGSITNSTISNNSSGFNIGGVDFVGGGFANKTLTITNSTISGNSAGYLVGGLYADAGIVNVSNSTIAFNTSVGPGPAAAGLALAVKTYSGAITLQSSILSNNTNGVTELDINTALLSPSIAGSNNLIRVAAYGTILPAGTLHGCPLLGPLRDNGGLTLTHALLSTSPAIDTGNSDVVRDYDQRGSAATNGVLDYPRISGPQPDIGAYEVQQNDIVFNAAFEGCPALP